MTPPLPPVRTIATRLGPVPVWGDIAPVDHGRPLVFVVRGTLPPRLQFFDLPARLPGVDVAIADLPGMRTPLIPEPSVPRFAVMLDEAVSAIAGARPVVVMGSSLGGVVALAMPRADALVLADPPLSTGALWPLVAAVRNPSLMDQPAFEDWAWRLLGIGRTVHENRDYRPSSAGAGGRASSSSPGKPWPNRARRPACRGS